MKCQRLLKKDGVVIVRGKHVRRRCWEQSARMAYLHDHHHTDALVPRAEPEIFNTAGVGVCFRSSGAWRAVFREAGLRTMYDDQGQVWELTGKRKLLFPLLAIRQISHRHFYLRVD